MKKIYNWFISLANDKKSHIIIMTMIVGIATFIFKACNFDALTSCCYGWGVGFALGILKEIIDLFKKDGSSSEASDWAADIITDTIVSLYLYILLII